MELIRYFFYKKRLFIYIGFSLVLALLFTYFAKETEALRLFFLFLIELWFLRFTDDWTDYEKDIALGKIQLKKEMLRVLIILFAVLFLGLNLLFFGICGLFSLGILLLIFYKETLTFIPPIIGLVSGIYYMSLTVPLKEIGLEEGLFLMVLLVFSVGFGIRKRKKYDF